MKVKLIGNGYGDDNPLWEIWSDLAYTITRKADWIYNEMAEEITERLQLMREEKETK